MKNRQSSIVNRQSKGFTLVELMIVVAILGILAAIVIPEFSGHIRQAKEAAAKDNLRILRETIERYANDHNGIPPGYQDNDPTKMAGSLYVLIQLVNSGDYLLELPENPLNGYSIVYIVENNETVTDGMAVGSAHGWVYQPATKTIKVNMTGTDSTGTSYFDY